MSLYVPSAHQVPGDGTELPDAGIMDDVPFETFKWAPEHLEVATWLRSDDASDVGIGSTVTPGDMPAHSNADNGADSIFVGANPTLEDASALEGIPYLDWSANVGSWNMGKTNMPSGGEPFSLAMVMYHPQTKATDGDIEMMSYGDGSDHAGMRTGDEGDAHYYQWWNGSNTSSFPSVITRQGWYYWIFRYRHADVEYDIWVQPLGGSLETDTQSIGGGAMGWDRTNGGHILGQNFSGSGGAWGSYFYEYLADAAAWTNQQVENLRGYFSGRYGFAGV